MNTQTAHAQRFNTDPILGTSAEGALFTAVQNSDGSLTITPAGNTDASLAARIYYTAAYYDAADRPIATVNAGTNPVGTNGTATPWTRPSTPPASSLLAPVSLESYNAAGWLATTTDANGDIIGVNGDFAGPLNILQNFFQSGVTGDAGYNSGTVEVQ